MTAFADGDAPWPAPLVTALRRVDTQLDALISSGIPASQHAASKLDSFVKNWTLIDG